MVAEADESDRSFLKLSPSIAVITNIDREHMESYGTWENLQQAFVDFANKVPFYGAVVACADDRAGARAAAAADAARHHLRARRQRRRRRRATDMHARGVRVALPRDCSAAPDGAAETLGALQLARARAATTC